MLKSKKIGIFVLAAALAITLLFGISGCGASKSQDKAAAPQPAANSGEVSKTNPLVVDKQAKTIKIYNEVNGKYFVEPTRHGIVFKDGSNGDKSVLKSLANQNDFYNALIEIGAKPGNNLDLNSAGKAVEGSPLDVTITWAGAGKEISFSDAIIDSGQKKADYRFGGNQERAESIKTGCILCLDSCPVGITSNAAYAFKAFDMKQVEFRGNKDVLPADGTPVIAIFKVKS